MSPLQLLILAVAAMFGLASLRLARVHFGRTPLPDGRGRLLFFVAFLVLPPVALAVLVDPARTEGLLRGVPSVPAYLVVVVGVAILMGFAALLVAMVAPGRSRPILLLALVGREADPDDLPFDPPVTAGLAESLAVVDRANGVFPRGPEFAAQIDRAGFRFLWDALDAATTTLEGRIADEYRLGLGVAISATETADDARSRLNTLRRFALDRGESWAS